MNIIDATSRYEKWLAKQMPIVKADLEKKHRDMTTDAFLFLRATYYWWAIIWKEICPDIASAEKVLAVGDWHIANIGTYRDSEGRLVLGGNDFDETYYLPYTNDLLRLATSACLALDSKRLAISFRAACEAILSGYIKSLKAGGVPIILAEENVELREMALNNLRDPVHFWNKMLSLPKVKGKVPKSAKKVLDMIMPKEIDYWIVTRQAGEGSLGRPRYTAIGEWHGGYIAREVKTLLPSAAAWAIGKGDTTKIFYQKILDKAVRCADPFFSAEGEWIARRLAPDCSRIELASLPKNRDERVLLEAMGWETGNIHLGTKNVAAAILKDLSRRPKNWLHNESLKMVAATYKGFKHWKQELDE